MNGLDTNLLVRWLADNDSAPEQTAAIAATLGGSETFHVNLIVLAEFAWTLAHSYGLPRTAIAGAVRAMLGFPRLSLERRLLVEAAVAAYEAGGPGLADHLIGLVNAEAGCATTLTFDKRAAKGPHFSLIA